MSSDIARAFIHDVGSAYAIVFFAECMLFFVAAKIAQSIEISSSNDKVTSSKTNSIISSSGNTT